MTEPCPDCDFIGPLWPVTQTSTDLHRAWHDLARAGARMFRDIQAAFARAAEAARTASVANYALTPPTDATEDTMTTPAPPLEVWRVEPHDDVTLTRKMGTVAGRVVRIQMSGTKGTGLYLYGRGLPYWIGPQHDTWTLTEHKPAIPAVLRVGARYHVMTSDDRHFQAHWSPIDGIRANHPWLHPDVETRYRQDLIVRARLADTESNDQ
jgi:hypothetical protein